MFKKVNIFYSAFCTHPAFYSQSAVCILHSVCILPLVRSLQSAVCSPQSAFYTDRLVIGVMLRYGYLTVCCFLCCLKATETY